MKTLAFLFISLISISCYQINSKTSSYSVTSEITHVYKVFAVDEKNKPLADVVVDYKICEEGREIIKKKIKTDERGVFIDSVNVREIYGSSLTYIAKLNGFCDKIGEISRNVRAISEINDETYYIVMKKPERTSHIYRIKVVDINKKSISGVNIEYSISAGEGNNKKYGKSYTNPQGNFIDSLEISSCKKKFYSTMELRLSKNDYYSKDSTFDFASNNLETQGLEISESGLKLQKDYDNEMSMTFTLFSPYDYFTESFLKSKIAANLRNNILQFLDLLIVQSYLNNCYLEFHSISVQSFKEKKYLQFGFNTNDVFNSIKMNKYDIGKNVFDEIIRKSLNPLNDYLSNAKDLYGFVLTVKSYQKNFLNEYEIPQTIEYKFFIPRTIVKKYKEKDITGQNVLDSSIILMDNERIELKLQ